MHQPSRHFEIPLLDDFLGTPEVRCSHAFQDTTSESFSSSQQLNRRCSFTPSLLTERFEHPLPTHNIMRHIVPLRRQPPLVTCQVPP